MSLSVRLDPVDRKIHDGPLPGQPARPNTDLARDLPASVGELVADLGEIGLVVIDVVILDPSPLSVADARNALALGCFGSPLCTGLGEVERRVVSVGHSE